MKKIIGMIFLLLCFIFTGCSTKTEDVPSSKEYMTGIQAVNIKGEVIKEDIEYQEDTIYEHKNVRIQAIYSDMSTQDVTPFASFSEASLSTIGEYEITVTLKNFSTKYMLKVLKKAIDHIEVTYSQAKIEYEIGEMFDSSNLFVEAIYNYGEQEKITDYSIHIFDAQNKEISAKDSFTATGEYTVEIRYNDFVTSYKITVLRKKLVFQEIRFDMLHLKREYYGDTFIAEGVNAFGINEDQSETELSSLDWKYEIYFEDKLVSNFEELGEYRVQFSYLKECVGTKTAFVDVFYSPYTSLEIELAKTVYQCEEKVDFNALKIYGIKKEEKEELPVNLYTVNLTFEGTMVSEFQEDGFYDICVFYKNIGLTYSTQLSILYSSNSLTDSIDAIDVDSILKEMILFPDAFSFSLEMFLNQAPKGYLLSGVLIEDANGTEIQDISYDGTSTNMAVTGLEPNKEYIVKPYYDLSSRGYSIREDITLGYRIHFVGFVALTSYGNEQTHKVRLMYEDKVLYTVLVSHGESIPFTLLESFLLPIQYENYECVGTQSDLNKILLDQDIEVILISRNEKNMYSVIFYDQNYRIIKLEKVEKNGSATPPKMLPEIIGSDGRTYTFTGWNKEYLNVVSTLKLVARYVDLSDNLPKFHMTSYSTSKSISIDLTINNYSNCKDYLEFYEVYILLPDQSRKLLGKVEDELSRQKHFVAMNLVDDTKYNIEVLFQYQESGNSFTKNMIYEVQTVPVKAVLPNVTMTLEDTSYQSIHVSSSSNAIMGIYCVIEAEPLAFQISTLDNNLFATLSWLKHNTSYAVGYYTQKNKEEAFTSYWLYDEQLTARTLEEEQPILPDKIYVRFFEHFAQIFIPKESYKVPESIEITGAAIVEYFELSQFFTENIFQQMVVEENYYVSTVNTSQLAPTEALDYYIGHLHTLLFDFFYDDFINVEYRITGSIIEWGGWNDVHVFERNAEFQVEVGNKGREL